MKATIPIAVPPGTRVLRLERFAEKRLVEVEYHEVEMFRGYWQLWIHANREITQGTVLRLYDDGAIDNITIDHDGIERLNFRVKDADK